MRNVLSGSYISCDVKGVMDIQTQSKNTEQVLITAAVSERTQTLVS